MAFEAHSERTILFKKAEVHVEKGSDLPSCAALLGTLYVAAVLVNYLWEVPQMVFYEWWGASWGTGLLVCFRAALGDGMLFLVLYGLGWALLRRRDWILRPGATGYTLLVLAGLVVAVAIEMHALAWNRWSYKTLMPLIPGLGVGLVPVAQMMILPTLIALLTRWWLLGDSIIGRRDESRSGG